MTPMQSRRTVVAILPLRSHGLEIIILQVAHDAQGGERESQYTLHAYMIRIL